MHQKKFVVVGAGQIGSLLARQLVGDGAVTVVSRTAKPVPDGAVFVAKDVLEDSLDDVFAGADVVFVAVNVAYDHRLWAKVLPSMHQRIADAAARQGCRLVVLENLYVYGARNAHQPLREDMAMAPSSKKGEVRATIARLLFERRDGLKVAGVRPPDFWGPGLTAALLDDKAIRGIVDGKAVFAVGDPDALHARAFVDDVAAALRAVGRCDDDDGDRNVWGRWWHAPSIHVSTRALVAAIAEAAGVADPGVRVVPRFALQALGLVVPVLREIDEMRYLWDRPHLVDDSALRARFGLVPTSLAEGAKACVAPLLATARRAAA
jgi:nucleoside-diphosphate-sugar epimerase